MSANGDSGFGELFVSHHVGDYLLQTDHQARLKATGLNGGGAAWRALAAHGISYTLAFTPAVVRTARQRGIGRAAILAAFIGVPHVVVDDGRLLAAFMRNVKRVDPEADAALTAKVDQSIHLVCLWLAAQLVGRD